jgi:hypothetical protein
MFAQTDWTGFKGGAMERSNEPDLGRRRLFKALAGVGVVAVGAAALPRRWTRPVIDSVLLPAHAQATGTVFGGAGLTVVGGGMAGMAGDAHYKQGPIHRLLDAVVPSAHAVAMSPSEPTATVCAMQAGNLIDVTLQRSQNNARRQGMLNIDGTPGTLSVIAQSSSCTETPNDLNARISGYTSSGLYLRFAPTGVDVTMDYIETYVPLTGTCPGFADLTGSCSGEH